MHFFGKAWWLDRMPPNCGDQLSWGCCCCSTENAQYWELVDKIGFFCGFDSQLPQSEQAGFIRFWKLDPSTWNCFALLVPRVHPSVAVRPTMQRRLPIDNSTQSFHPFLSILHIPHNHLQRSYSNNQQQHTVQSFPFSSIPSHPIWERLSHRTSQTGTSIPFLFKSLHLGSLALTNIVQELKRNYCYSSRVHHCKAILLICSHPLGMF